MNSLELVDKLHSAFREKGKEGLERAAVQAVNELGEEAFSVFAEALCVEVMTLEMLGGSKGN